MEAIQTGVNLVDIFLNNSLLGLMLSVLGFFTAGLLTVGLLFWNGYMLGIVYSAAFRVLDVGHLLYYSKHIPLELYGLVLFSQMGFKGFFFFREILLERGIRREAFLDLKGLALPTLCLLLAACLEVL